MPQPPSCWEQADRQTVLSPPHLQGRGRGGWKVGGGVWLCVYWHRRGLCVCISTCMHEGTCARICGHIYTWAHTQTGQQIIYDTQHANARTKHVQSFDLYIHCIYRMSKTIMQFKMTRIPEKCTTRYLNNQEDVYIRFNVRWHSN